MVSGEMAQQGLEHAVPGLENFYMIGQWVEGGGLPGVALRGTPNHPDSVSQGWPALHHQRAGVGT